jgi:Domain of unknown function (DUF4395)
MRSRNYPAQLNERAARLTAAFVAVALLLAGLTGSVWLLPVLALGFVLRATAGPRFSPLARLAAALALRFWPVRPVAAAPKRFAQGIGAAVLASASLLAYGGYAATAWGLAGVVALLATLEATLGFCMGCWIYGRLQRNGWLGPAVCVDCAPARPVRGQPAS